MSDNSEAGNDGKPNKETEAENEGIWSNVKSLGSHLFGAAMDWQEIQTDVVTAVPKAIHNENKEEINAAAGDLANLAGVGLDFEMSTMQRSLYNIQNKPVTTLAETLILPGLSIVHAHVAEGFDRLTK